MSFESHIKPLQSFLDEPEKISVKIVSSRQLPKVECLEGLRGLAAVIVVFTHIQHFFFPEINEQIKTVTANLNVPLSTMASAFFKAFFNGIFSVWVFWVISGFVLSYRYFLFSQQGCNTYQYLFVAVVKRYFRLAIPVLLSVLIALILIKMDLISHKALAQHYLTVHPNWHKYIQWLSDFYSFKPDFFNALKSAVWESFILYDRATTYNPVLWTIEKEFVGSLFLYAFLAVLYWTGNKKWLWIATLLFLTLTHLHWITAFLLGAAICNNYCLLKNEEPATLFTTCKQRFVFLNKSFVSIICVLWLWLLVGLTNNYAVVNLAIATALVFLALILAPFKRILSTRPLQFLGKISFGLYLGHFLLIASFSSSLYLLLVEHCSSSTAAVLTTFFTVALSMPVAWLIYRLGDIPGRKLSNAVGKLINRKMD